MPTNHTAQSGIYAIRHVASGKLYIGSAACVAKRWGCHRHYLVRGLHHSSYLQRAWNKHGADAFVFEVLEAVEDKADLIRVEQEYLDHFQTWRDSLGYNMSPTAGSCLGTRRTAEYRAKLSAAARNRSPEHRARLAESARNMSPEHRAKLMVGRKNYAHGPEVRARIGALSKGRTLSPEHRAKIAASLEGKKHSPERRARLSEAAKRREAAKREIIDRLAELEAKVGGTK